MAAKHKVDAITKACKDKKPGDMVKVNKKEVKCPEPKSTEPKSTEPKK